MYDERIIDPIERVAELEDMLRKQAEVYEKSVAEWAHKCRKAEEDSKYWQMRCDELNNELQIRNGQISIVRLIFAGREYE